MFEPFYLFLIYMWRHMWVCACVCWTHLSAGRRCAHCIGYGMQDLYVELLFIIVTLDGLLGHWWITFIFWISLGT